MEEAAAAEQVVERQPMMAEEKRMKVLVPIDESDGSFYALKWALDHLFSNYTASEPPLAAAPAEEENFITLVNVQPLFLPMIYPAGPVAYAYTTQAVIDSVKKGQQQNAANILARALHMCKLNKVKAETLILEGDPKDKICQAADELHVDLLVIGSRGLGTIKRALLGSVSNYCAHHAKCPVLIVKPPPRSAHE